MKCVVTAGPTFEPLDKVRRLTNFSSGRLGSELASELTAAGHEVHLLLGEQATWRGDCRAARIERFSTTANLGEKLRACSAQGVGALFHAAAVSDFGFGQVWARTGEDLQPVVSGKISTRQGILLAELVPTPKIIASLREWYPDALLVGWKYEVEGDRESVCVLARGQILECRTNACIGNGPAYGQGFAMVLETGAVQHCATTAELFAALTGMVAQRL